MLWVLTSWQPPFMLGFQTSHAVYQYLSIMSTRIFEFFRMTDQGHMAHLPDACPFVTYKIVTLVRFVNPLFLSFCHFFVIMT